MIDAIIGLWSVWSGVVMFSLNVDEMYVPVDSVRRLNRTHSHDGG